MKYTSTPWMVLVAVLLPLCAYAQPANDDCAGAVPATFIRAEGTGCATPTTLNFDTDGTTDSGVPAVCSNPGKDQFFTWTATTPSLRFVEEPPGRPGVAIYANCADAAAGNEIACLNTQTDGTLSGWSIGDNLIIQIYDFQGSDSQVDFCLEEFTPPPAPANDECSGATNISPTLLGDPCSFTTINTAGATQSANPSCTGISNNDDVWYTFIASSSEAQLVYQNFQATGGSSSGLGFALFAGCGGTEETCFFTFGDGTTGTQDLPTLTPGDTYVLQLFSQGSLSFATFDLCILNTSCTSPVGSVPTFNRGDCPNGTTYNVSVTDLGQASEVIITTNAGSTPLTVTTPGTYPIVVPGPSPNARFEFTLTDGQDPTCFNEIGSFVAEACPPPTPQQSCSNLELTLFSDELDDAASTALTSNFDSGNGSWQFDSDATGSPDTGPNAPQSGAGYVYFEASGNNTTTAVMTTPSIDLAGGNYDAAELTFFLHAYGADIGTLEVIVDDGTNQDVVLVYGGRSQTAETDPWLPVGVDLTPYIGGNVTITFSHTGSGGFRGDLAIDLVEVNACVPIPPVAETTGCTPVITAVVDGSGSPTSVNFLDGSGAIVATIGNSVNLGSVDVFLWDGPTPLMIGNNSPTDHEIGRHVTIVPTNQPPAGSPATVTIFVTGQEVTDIIAADPNINSASDLQFVKKDNTSCSPTFDGNGTILPLFAFPYNGPDFALLTTVQSFSEFFIVGQSALLPVELTSFTGEARKEGNLLRWTSATEIDFARYVIERSTDGLDFTALAEVAPTGGESLGASYELNDPDPAPVSYYRLRMEDLDGSVEHSNVLRLERATTAGFTLTPNPATERVRLTFSDDGAHDVFVTDVSGRRFRTLKFTGVSAEVELNDLAAGVYFVTVRGAAGASTRRLLVR